MAAIDKLYGNKKQYEELKEWLQQYNPKLINELIDPSSFENQNDLIIAMFSEETDKWLYIHCPLQFVIDRLNEQYTCKTRVQWLFEQIESDLNSN